jgi:hypothetical protein
MRKTLVGTFGGDRIADLAALTFWAAHDEESGRPGCPRGLRPLATKIPADQDTEGWARGPDRAAPSP